MGAGRGRIGGWAGCWCSGGCEIDWPPAGFAVCAPEPLPPPPDGGAALDYWHDAKPILDAQCASCHVAGGIGPFPIVSHADVMTGAG